MAVADLAAGGGAGAPTASIAERRLKVCEEALEDFAERVFTARHR